MIVVSVMWAATNSFAEQPSSPNSFCSSGTSVPVLQKIPLTPRELRAQLKDRVTLAVAAGFRSSSCRPLLSCVLIQGLVRLGHQPNQGTNPSTKKANPQTPLKALVSLSHHPRPDVRVKLCRFLSSWSLGLDLSRQIEVSLFEVNENNCIQQGELLTEKRETFPLHSHLL